MTLYYSKGLTHKLATDPGLTVNIYYPIPTSYKASNLSVCFPNYLCR